MRSAINLRALGQRPMLLAAGIATAGLMAVLAMPHSHTSALATTEPASHAALTVLVASHRLTAGTIVGPNDIQAVAGTAQNNPALTRGDIVGHILVRNYAAREIISPNDLKDTAALGIAAQVAPGRRAFSIRVTEDDIVGGFLQSGDHVDVFATIPGSVFPNKNLNDAADRSRAVLLLQDIPVLAVGENPATRGSIQTSARTVSLSIDPDGLARLALAERFGKVSLAIRNPADRSPAASVSATISDLVPSPVPQTPRLSPKHRTVRGIPFLSGVHSSSLSRGDSR